MKKFLLLAAFAAGSVFAQPSVKVPYDPSSKVTSEIAEAPAWVEYYFVPADGFQEALAQLEAADSPPLWAVSSPDKFHFQLGAKPSTLALVRTEVERDGTRITYSGDCKTVPQVGDVLRLSYQGKSPRVKVDIEGVVRDYRIFGTMSPFSSEEGFVRLSETSMSDCHRASEVRILFQGNARVLPPTGKAFSLPTLAQSILLK